MTRHSALAEIVGASIEAVSRRDPAVPDLLDVAFYGDFYTDLHDLSDQQLIAHWRANGLRDKRHPNLESLLAKYASDGKILPAGFSVAIYKWLNPDLRTVHSADWEFLLHYLDHGRIEGRPCLVDDSPFFNSLYFPGRRSTTSDIEALLASDEIVYLSLSAMLEANGIESRAFVALFDTNDYLVLHPDEGLCNGIQCLRHFAETGRKALAPVALDHAFDPAFYGDICPDARRLAPAEAYLHWLNVGLPRKAAPNLAIFLQQLGLPDLARFPDGFDPELYLAANPDLQPICVSKWLALQHFVENGIVEHRAGTAITAVNLPIYAAAADRLAHAGQDAAKGIYEAILLIDPGHLHALGRHASILATKGEFYLAAQLCQRRLDLFFERGLELPLETLRLLADCQFELQQWPACCETMSELARRYPGDVAIETYRRETVAKCYEAVSRRAMLLACHGAYPAGRQTMQAAAALLTAPILSAAPVVNRADRPVRAVGIVADISLQQCRFYRVEQKVEQFRQIGIDILVFDHASALDEYAGRVPFLDAVIFYRVPATPAVVEAIMQARRAGLPTFYEIDDPIFDETHYPDTFESYGGQISKDVYAGLVTGTALFRAAMSLCDYALASTPTLAEAMAPAVLSGKAFLHRNALGAAHIAAMARAAQPVRRAPAGGPVRIFYGTATHAHNEDFAAHAAPALARLLDRGDDDVELVLMGYLTLPECLLRHRHRITCLEPVWDVETYWAVLAEMDISIAVLKPGHVADCKSEIKWLEAAMLGIPSVVTGTATYRDVIEDGVTGLLASTPEDWFMALRSLIRDPKRRRMIGDAARSRIVRSYDPAAMAANLTRIFSAVTAKRAAPCVQRQKILVVHVFYAPQAIGGATRVVASNLQDLTSRYGDEFEIEVFCSILGGASPYVTSTYRQDGIKVTGITTPDDPMLERRSKDPRMAQAFEEVVDRFCPDIIHIHCVQRLTASVCDVASAKKIPYLVTVHDGWWISDSQFLVDENAHYDVYDYANPAGELQRLGTAGFARMRSLAAALSGADRILAVSEHFARLHRGLGFERVQTVANGLPAFDILPRTASADGRVRLTHAGNTTNHKGYHLIKAALSRADLRNLHLTVVDHGMKAGSVRHARWGGTDVRFQPKLPQVRVGELYAATDVLLGLSVWPESHGLVTREALAAGCWVVASDRGAIGHDVTAGSGFVIDVSSYQPTLEVLRHINDNPQRYLGPIETPPTLRPASAQADELAVIYRSFRKKEKKGQREQGQGALPPGPPPGAEPLDPFKAAPGRVQPVVPRPASRGAAARAASA